MLIEVKVPQLSESVAEATLVAWRKKPGEPVSRDENLIDIETDKVVLERPSPFEIVDEVAGHTRGDVPSYPLGTVHTEFAKLHGLPFEATQGGRASQYPEFARAIRGMSREMPTRAAPSCTGPAAPACRSRARARPPTRAAPSRCRVRGAPAARRPRPTRTACRAPASRFDRRRRTPPARRRRVRGAAGDRRRR